jgi:hypothetical protein
MKKIFFASIVVLAFGVSYVQGQTEKAIAIGAGEHWRYSFSIPNSAAFAGKFRARGGSGNDVEVYILDEDGYENWANGHSTETYYNSGRKTVGSFNVRLSPGKYFLVISNRFSVVTAKAVTLTLIDP